MFNWLRKSGWRGHIDLVSDGSVKGWAQDSSNPQKRLVVEVYADEALLGTVLADGFRADLVDAGIGDGRFAFVFVLPSATPTGASISARVEGTHYWLISNSNSAQGATESTEPAFDANVAPAWARALSDPQQFRHEQEALSHTWTFLGLTREVEKDGDWFRSSLATREVFVQRFGSELLGFENICPHRSYPLRHADRGNGAIICGFHHWQFNRDGLAVGIPKCRELYCKLPHELGARLTSIDVATCGSLVFGRFSSDMASQSLQEFLAEGFPILESLSRMANKPQVSSNTVKANWKLNLHITLDDYHPPAVHPPLLGKASPLMRTGDCTYRQFGPHSCFLATPDTKAFDRMVAGCRDGAYGASHYSIFQIFPNLIVSLTEGTRHHWYCDIQQFIPLAHDRSRHRRFFYLASLAVNPAWHNQWIRFLTAPIVTWVAVRYARRIAREDRAVCERIQEVAHQIRPAPVLGALERRIGWFEKAYRDIVNTRQ